ncbi:amino acid permease [Dactylosporangium sp. NPDC005572]|uniref:APC family permease n=1 Tax=Dactylosporangium sp. NPDC005572 TaxID=3156889 RepID=UPI0033B3EF0E
MTRLDQTGRARIGFAHAAALYVGALLGPGVLTLPALAAAIAGPGSLLAWAVLVAASIPLAGTFTGLAVRYPGSGGVSAFAARAYGPRAFAVIGWWFFAATPIAVYVAARIGGQYVAAAVGGGQPVAVGVTAAIVAVVFAANLRGLRASGRVQLIVIGSLIALLGTATLTAARHLDSGNFTPLLPGGPVPVAHAAVTLFIAFAGWEAAAHLTDGVADPRRTLPRVAAATVAIVGALYLGVAAVTVGVLGTDVTTTHAPLIALLRHGVGPAAAPLAALVALLLTGGAANTFLAGSTRLGIALAERGALPARIVRGGHRSSLAVQAALTAGVAAGSAALHIELADLLRTVSVLLAAVTVAGTSAGILLLPAGRRWIAAVTATVVTAAVLGAAGPLLAVPALLGVLAVAWPHFTRRPTRAAERTVLMPASAATAPALPLDGTALVPWRRRPPHRSRRRKPRRRHARSPVTWSRR